LQRTDINNPKIKKISIIAFLLLLTLSSCTKNEVKKQTIHKTTYRRWSMIGCHIADTYEGIKVVSINKNSAAEKGNLQIKDIVLELNDKPGNNTAILIQKIRESLPQTKIKLKIRRNGNEKILFLTTIAYPIEPQLKKMIVAANKSGDFFRALELIKEYERVIATSYQSKKIIRLKKKLMNFLKEKTN